MFAGLSEAIPVVKENVGRFVALGPAAVLENHNIPLYSLLETFTAVTKVLDFVGIRGEVLSLQPGSLADYISRPVCGYFPTFCAYVLGLAQNSDPELDSMNRMELIM